MGTSPIEVCEKCGMAMETARVENPALARCRNCGHEMYFVWDPAPQPDASHDDSDAVLIIDSTNGKDLEAAAAIRPLTGLTSSEALALVHQAQPKLTLSHLASIDFLRIPRGQLPTDGTHDPTSLDNSYAYRSSVELSHPIPHQNQFHSPRL